MRRAVLDINTSPSCPPVAEQVTALSEFLRHHRRTASRAELQRTALLLDGLACRLHAMASTCRAAAKGRP